MVKKTEGTRAVFVRTVSTIIHSIADVSNTDAVIVASALVLSIVAHSCRCSHHSTNTIASSASSVHSTNIRSATRKRSVERGICPTAAVCTVSCRDINPLTDVLMSGARHLQHRYLTLFSG